MLELRHPERLRRLRLEPLASEDVRRLLKRRTGRTFTRAVSTGSTTPPPATLSWRSSSRARWTRQRRAGLSSFPESLRRARRRPPCGLEARVLEALLLAAALDAAARRLDPARARRPRPAKSARTRRGGGHRGNRTRSGPIHTSAAGNGRLRGGERHRPAPNCAPPPAPWSTTPRSARGTSVSPVSLADPEIVAALEAGAMAARARGAPADAAELLEIALNLGDA